MIDAANRMQITLNGEPREVADDLTLAELLQELGITVRHVAVEINRRLVPRAEHATQSIAPGDSLEVVTLVGGG